ncbi:Hypothetical predicted protein [Cloeon dipterum]|uniref:Aryl hydrocarbon receptor n=1 Tax=Cloeon dipterum TaxID=197152 RepID=A0A8S1CG64_9INSE|nr:Hypothetical predicted protein [Cloeon dipterum]
MRPHQAAPCTASSQLGTVYATKRRRRNGKSIKPPPKDGVAKSNPSKRHRERLNAELDTLASLLPFEQNILSKLDRLSILRLAVSYLRTKSYFHVVMHRDKEDGLHGDPSFRSRDLTALDHSVLDGDMFLQALNGFLLILTCEGEVFFATHTIESYLGFHQSDIVHQSVYELVHSEDREELQRQLLWNSFLPTEHAGCALPEALDNYCQLLERSFTVRFRCLLDNTSGFLRLDIRGRVKVLHGQNRKTEDPPMALFAICTPFGPPSLLEVPQKEVMFKSKHKLDLSHVSMDQRGKLLLGYTDAELANMGGYHLVHYDDLAYVASAHQELLKTGASGMIAYRYQTKEGNWQWLQTSSRLVYKNSKPDFVICTHRPLMEEEGRDLLGKRTMDFKVSYLDAGLTNTYFADSDSTTPSISTPTSSPAPRVTRRYRHFNKSSGKHPKADKANLNNTDDQNMYKTQLRDFLSTCRSKRKLQSTPPAPESTPPTPPEVVAPTISAPPPPPPVTAYYYPAEYPQYPQYPTSAVDTSVFQYRYYPAEYAPPAAMPYTNGYGLERVMNTGYEVKTSPHDERLQYPPCQLDGYFKAEPSPPPSVHSSSLELKKSPASPSAEVKLERQTVLMWGSTRPPTPPSAVGVGWEHHGAVDPLKSLADMQHYRAPSPVSAAQLHHHQYTGETDNGHQQLSGGEPVVRKQEQRSPLLSISEVTNTLLDH